MDIGPVEQIKAAIGTTFACSLCSVSLGRQKMEIIFCRYESAYVSQTSKPFEGIKQATLNLMPLGMGMVVTDNDNPNKCFVVYGKCYASNQRFIN